MENDPQYAIVVATRNRGTKLAPLVESILALATRDFELVIVDQSTTDESERFIARHLDDARVQFIHTDEPGASRARNIGISVTTAPIVVITDDDCLVPRDWLSRMAAPFHEHPDVGVVFCNVDPLPVEEPGHTPYVRFDGDRTVSDVRTAWAAEHLSLGAGMAIRRRALDDVIGFDEALGPGAEFPAAEDNDLAWRALLRGWRVYETTGVTVLHDGFRTLDEMRELVKRDFYGLGGTIAKYLRARRWGITRLLVRSLYRYGIAEPGNDVLHGRKPRGFRRPYMLLRGLVDGLRRPMDRSSICYRPAVHSEVAAAGGGGVPRRVKPPGAGDRRGARPARRSAASG